MRNLRGLRGCVFVLLVEVVIAVALLIWGVVALGDRWYAAYP